VIAEKPVGCTDEQWRAHRAAVAGTVRAMQRVASDYLHHGGPVRVAGAAPAEYVAAVVARRLDQECARERRREQGARYWDLGEDRYDAAVGPELWALRQVEARAAQRAEAATRVAAARAAWVEDAAARRRLRGPRG
jgi:hypothetical protein